MPEYIKILVVFLLVINVVTFFVYGMDKAASKRGQSQKHFGSAERKQFRTKSNRKAKRSAWRIPEMTLLLLAVIGGSAGGVGDETVSNQSPDAKCITVNANNFMGGVSIKN